MSAAARVPLTALGRSGLAVSRLGLGLAALGRPGYINIGHAADLEHDYDVEAMRQRAHAVLDAAWAAGVRYFDTARSYGAGEEFLAGWLTARGVAPDAVAVGSKWGYTYTAGWRTEAAHHEVKDHSLPVLTRQLAESRALLGAHLDLYQIHSVTPDSGVLRDRAVLDALARLRAEGVRIGLTLSGPRQGETLRLALAATAAAPVFDAVQVTWNLLETSAAPALVEARAAGLGIIVKEGLANGRLTTRNTSADFAAPRRVLDAVAARLHTSVDALALAAVLAQPWADVVLSGAATSEQLKSNLGALAVAWDTGASVELAALAETPEQYWSTRSTLHWN